MDWYIGWKKNNIAVIFPYSHRVTEDRFGRHFLYATGPFKSIRFARDAAMYANGRDIQVVDSVWDLQDNPGVEWHEERYDELLRKKWPKGSIGISKMIGRASSRKEAANTGVDTGEEWHRKRKDSLRQQSDEKTLSQRSKGMMLGKYTEEEYSKAQSRKLGINPEKDLDKKVSDFVHTHGIAHGGNWSAMFMDAIRHGAPEVFEKMEDKSYNFGELYDIIESIVRKNKNPLRSRHGGL